jgi:hypothetical protein
VSIIATAPVAAPLRLDQADTLTMPLLDPFAPSWVPVPTCPIGTVWCVEHTIIDGTDQSCHGETEQIDTDTPGEHPVQVYLSRLAVPAHDHVDDSIVVGDAILTAEQALQLAAALTDRAMRLLGGDR